MQESATYSITARGRAVLRGPAAWALSNHTRDLLALCDPQVSVRQARQFLPPESLHAALFSLCELALVEGPPVKAPRLPAPGLPSGGRPAGHREANNTPAG